MLARLRRCDHRMSTGVRMFAGVLIWRAVAAQRDSTCLACAQMNPVTTDFHALFAFPAFRLFDGFDCIQMRTAAGIHDLFTLVIFWLVTGYAGMRGSDGFRRRPFRLRRQPLRNASPIQSGRRRRQRFPEDSFQAERGGVCFRATLGLPRPRHQF